MLLLTNIISEEENATLEDTGNITDWKSMTYHKIFNIRGTWVGDEIVYHSDVLGASPVGAAPTTSSFSI